MPNSENANNQLDLRETNRQAEQATLEAAVKRSIQLCYVLAIAHCSYGFTSFAFLKKIDPDLTLIQNVLPRILLNVCPFIVAAILLTKKKWSPEVKIKFYIWFYSIQFFIAACIKVWPLAMAGHQDVFLYVGGVNTAYLCATWALAAFPTRFLFHAAASVLLLIVAPIFFINLHLGNSDISNTVMSDTFFAMLTGLGIGYLASKVHWQLAVLQAEYHIESSKYIEAPIQKAILEKNIKVLETKECTAYVLVIDIRDSTNLTRKYKEEWAKFTSAWLGSAIEIIKKHSGTFVKSTGDGLVAAFGLFDEDDILKDLPHLAQKDSEADEARWINLTVDAFGCVSELLSSLSEISNQFFPEEKIKIGCGLDRGPVFRGVRGGKSRREFDIWGDKVNTAAKLESFSKTIQSGFPKDSSLLVVSPYACDFLEELEGFKKVEITEDIRGSLFGMRWVMVKSYNRLTKSQKSAA